MYILSSDVAKADLQIKLDTLFYYKHGGVCK